VTEFKICIYFFCKDAANGEFASAIETLVTAISLIKQSKVAADDRCKILISSLQDTLHGIENKSYGHRGSGGGGSGGPPPPHHHHHHRERSRSRERHRMPPAHPAEYHHRRRSYSRERDYRGRSRERDYHNHNHHHHAPREYYRERSRSRERDYRRDKEYYEERERYKERERMPAATGEGSRNSSSRGAIADGRRDDERGERRTERERI